MINFYDHVRSKFAELCPEQSIVLEAGSGEGKLIQLLKTRRPIQLIGCDRIDYSEKYRDLGVTFVKCSITHLPFKTGKFTVSLVSNVFLEQTRKETKMTISEIARITKKKGLVLISSYNSNSPVYALKMTLRWKIFLFSIFPIGYSLNFIARELKRNRIRIKSVVPFILHPNSIKRTRLDEKLIIPASLLYHNIIRKNHRMSLMYLFQSEKT